MAVFMQSGKVQESQGPNSFERMKDSLAYKNQVQ